MLVFGRLIRLGPSANAPILKDPIAGPPIGISRQSQSDAERRNKPIARPSLGCGIAGLVPQEGLGVRKVMLLLWYLRVVGRCLQMLISSPNAFAQAPNLVYAELRYGEIAGLLMVWHARNEGGEGVEVLFWSFCGLMVLPAD